MTIYGKKYVIPFSFMGKKYRNSRELVKAFCANWDIATFLVRTGELEDFFRKLASADDGNRQEWERQAEFCREICDMMWQTHNVKDDDILFTKVIHCMEPTLRWIPMMIPGDDQVKCLFYDDVEELLEWDYTSPDDVRVEPPYEYDAEDWQDYMIGFQALKYHIYSDYFGDSVSVRQENFLLDVE